MIVKASASPDVGPGVAKFLQESMSHVVRNATEPYSAQYPTHSALTVVMALLK